MLPSCKSGLPGINPIAEAYLNPSTPFQAALSLSMSSRACHSTAMPYFKRVAKIFDLSYSNRAEMMEGIKERMDWLDSVLPSRAIPYKVRAVAKASLSLKAPTTAFLNFSELEKLIQARKDRDLLAVANRVARLYEGWVFEPFYNAEEAREFFNNPANAIALAQVSILDLSACDLAFCPPEIGRLVNLQHLNLSKNLLRALPAEIGNLVHLRMLNLNCNQLDRLCPEIGRLGALQKLKLSQNLFEDLPQEVGELENLEGLDLSHNLLRVVPRVVWDLEKLTTLILSDNELRRLPRTVEELVELQVLDLSCNVLEELPLEINQLAKLKSIKTLGNPLRVSSQVGEHPRKVRRLN